MDVVIVTMLFGVLGIVIGYKVGQVLGQAAQTDRQYWLRNLAVVLVGIAVSAVVAATGLVTLVGLALGLIGGAIAGLKFGYGKSVGVWNKHDTVFRVNKDQVKAAQSAREAQEAGMTEEQRAQRDLVSVGDTGASSNKAPQNPSSRKGR